MTSKISFSKLLKEDMRHRLGINVVMLLSFLFVLLSFVISAQNAMVYGDWTWDDIYKNMLSSTEPGNLLYVCAALGAINAFCGLSYLHSRTKTDFYHSLPVGRTNMFRVIAVNSFLVCAALLLVSMAIEGVITAVMGFFSVQVFTNLCLSAVCSLLAFATAFFTAALAMIMTGHIVVGILGTAVFVTWLPVIVKFMLVALQSIFFASYVEQPQVFALLDYGSPVYLSFRLEAGSAGWSLEEKGLILLAVCVWIVVLVAICQWLFVRRPSEAAGNAMAFPKCNPVIRTLLVIPAAVYTGCYLYSMTLSSSRIWIVVGIVMGTILFHGMIECIYRFDIRGMWSSNRQMLLTMAAVFAFVATFYMDIYGYDSYVPAADRTDGVFVQTFGFGEQESFFWGEKRKGADGEEMKTILALLDSALDEAAPQEDSAEAGGYQNMEVTYYMKNGNEVKRNYVIKDAQASEIMETAYRSESYRESVYSLYTADWDDITAIDWTNMLKRDTLQMTPEERTQFLTVYLQELDTLTYEQIRKTMPLVEISVSHDNEEVGWYSSEDYYYVYPTFTKTLAFLESKGCDTDKTLADVDISKIDITYNGSGNEDTRTEWTVTNPEVIQSVKDKLTISDSNFSSYTTAYEKDSLMSEYDITVSFADNYEEYVIFVWTDAATIETLKQAADSHS